MELWLLFLLEAVLPFFVAPMIGVIIGHRAGGGCVLAAQRAGHELSRRCPSQPNLEPTRLQEVDLAGSGDLRGGSPTP